MAKVMFLPLTPGKHQNFETLMGPLLADIVSRICCVPLDVVFNTAGSFKNFKESYEHYLKQLEKMGIQLNKYDHDESLEYYQYIKDLTFSLFQRKKLFISQESIMVCECGKVEIPCGALDQLLITGRGKLIYGNKCKHCGTSLKEKKENVLKMSFCQENFPIHVWPVRYQIAIQSISDWLKENSLIVSRCTRSGQKVELNGNEFTLDTDFRWMACVNYFSPKNEHICIVASSDCLNQASKIIYLSHLINPSLKYTLIVHPLIEVVGLYKFSKMGIDDYLNTCQNREVARTFLSLGIQWSKESTILNSSEFHLVKKSVFPREIKVDKNEKDVIDFAQILQLVNRNTMINFLKSLRARGNISSNEVILKNNVSLI